MPFKGKKKDLFSPLYERASDIFYKCMESRVAIMDDVRSEKLCLLHAILSDFKCDWAIHIYDCLEYYVLKSGVEEGDTELRGNVGYGFMVSNLLKLNGIALKPGSEVNPHTYLLLSLRPL